MKIAYFTDTYAPEINGVTNTLLKLGSYLDNRNIRQMVFAPKYDKNFPNIHSGCRNVRRYKGFTTSLSTESRLAFPAFWEIDEVCDGFKPDIVHVTTELGIGFRGMRYALSRNIPLVMSYHTDYCKYLKFHKLEILKPLLEKYLAWFYSFPARILVPSHKTLTELSEKGYCNLELWSRGIDTSCFNPAWRTNIFKNFFGKEKKVFLYVGRLSREKNLDMLLDAAKKIENLFPGKTAFVFTGDGPYSEKIKNSSLPNVVFFGFKRGSDLSEIYASADCFAFPSGTETFGNVVLEAMASGLPVAGVASGGVTDFLFHGQNALLCEAGNTEAYINNLAALIKDENLRIRLAANARASVLSRSWESIFDGLVNIYETVINENRQDEYKLSA